MTLWHAGRISVMAFLRMERSLCRSCDPTARAWARGILRAAGVTVEIHDADRLLCDRAQLVVSNHESWFDVFALFAYLPVRVRFVAKKELARIPLFGRAWRACGHVSVDRSDRSSAIESLNEAARRIREAGLTIVMFPEGTRSADGELQKFKKGAFVLGIQAGAPIVPVCITGSRPIMPKGSYRVRPGHIDIRIGEPIPVEGLAHEDRDDLALRTREAVSALRGGDGPTSLLPGEAGH